MTTGDEVQLVSFRVGGRDFAFNVFEVERILRFQQPAPLPKAPDFLEGTLQYGGAVVPVIDFRKRLGIDAPIRDETRIMVIESELGRVGVVVDAVLEVFKVAAESITPPSGLVRDLAAAYINGILPRGERTIVILAASKVLTSTERLALEALTVETAHD
jgi:purine-binding chemotaxis protein CheW